VDAANHVEAAIYEACAFLADTPLAGRTREDLTGLPLRFWVVQPYRNYWVVYDPERSPLQVIRIIHAGAKCTADIEVGRLGTGVLDVVMRLLESVFRFRSGVRVWFEEVDGFLQGHGFAASRARA
jgi:plasmid stabilization system protein ParE